MLWIGLIVIEPAVEAKLREKHDLTRREVNEGLTCGAAKDAAWNTHPVYGTRLLVTGETSTGRRLIGFLKPIDEHDGTWELLTAWERDDGR
jgi:hypothetical protein